MTTVCTCIENYAHLYLFVSSPTPSPSPKGDYMLMFMCTFCSLFGSAPPLAPPPKREYMLMCPLKEAVLMMAGLQGHQ